MIWPSAMPKRPSLSTNSLVLRPVSSLVIITRGSVRSFAAPGSRRHLACQPIKRQNTIIITALLQTVPEERVVLYNTIILIALTSWYCSVVYHIVMYLSVVYCTLYLLVRVPCLLLPISPTLRFLVLSFPISDPPSSNAVLLHYSSTLYMIHRATRVVLKT